MRLDEVRWVACSRFNKLLIFLILLLLLDVLPLMISGETELETELSASDFVLRDPGFVMESSEELDSEAGDLLDMEPVARPNKKKDLSLTENDVEFSKENMAAPETPEIMTKAAALGTNILQRPLWEQTDYFIYADYPEDDRDGVWVLPDNRSLGTLERPQFAIDLQTNLGAIEPIDPTPVDISGNGSADIQVKAGVELQLDGAELLGDLISVGLDPGNAAEASDWKGLISGKPGCVILFPLTDGRTVFADITVRGEAQDTNSRLDRVEFRLTSSSNTVPSTYSAWQTAELLTGPLGRLGTFSFPLEASAFENGNYTIEARAFSGSQVSDVAVRNITIANSYYDTDVVMTIEGVKADVGKPVRTYIVYPTTLNSISNGIGGLLSTDDKGSVPVIMIGLNMSDSAASFELRLDPNVVKFNTEVADPTALLNLAKDGLSLRPLDGPFDIEWGCSQVLDELSIEIGYARVGSDGRLSDSFFVDVKLSGPAPKTGELRLKMDNELVDVPVQILREVKEISFDLSAPCSVDVGYMELKPKKSYSEYTIFSADLVPKGFKLLTENLTKEYNKDVPKDEWVNYYELTTTGTGDLEGLELSYGIFESGKLINLTRASISNLPTNMSLKGPFSLRRPLARVNSTTIIDHILKSFTSVLFMGVDTMVDIPNELLRVESGEIDLSIGADDIGTNSIRSINMHMSQHGNTARLNGSKGITAPGEHHQVVLYQNTGDDFPSLDVSFYGLKRLDLVMNTSFAFNVETTMDRPFGFINIHKNNLSSTKLDGYDFESFAIQDVPSQMSIALNRDIVPFSMDVDTPNGFKRMRFISGRYNELTSRWDYLDLDGSGLPNKIHFSQEDTEFGQSIRIDTSGDGFGKMAFTITNGGSHTLEDNFAYYVTEADGSIELSGAFYGLKALSYSEEENDTFMDCRFSQNKPFRAYYRSDDEDPEENMMAKVYINQLPSDLHLSIPSQGSDVATPDPMSDFGKPDNAGNTIGAVAGVFAGIGQMISDMLTASSSSPATAVSQSVSETETRFNMDYEFDTPLKLTVSAMVQRGEFENYEPPLEGRFVHGITVYQEFDRNATGNPFNSGALEAKIFLTGLPKSGSIAYEATQESINASFDLQDFDPKYRDINIISRGIMGHDVDVNIFNLEPEIPGEAIDLDLEFNVDFDMENTTAEGSWAFETNGVSPSLNLEGVIRDDLTSDLGPVDFQVAIDGLPGSIAQDFVVGNELLLVHRADDFIDQVTVNLTSGNGTDAVNLYSVLKEIPSQIRLYVSDIEPDEDSISVPVDVERLPTFDIQSSNNSLDAYLLVQGGPFGEDSKIELMAENLTNRIYSYHHQGDYRVMVKNLETGHFNIRNLDLGTLTIKKLILNFDNIESAKATFFFTGGLYPGLMLTGEGSGKIEYQGKFQTNFLGVGATPYLALRKTEVLDGPFPVIFGSQTRAGSFDLEPDEESQQFITFGMLPTLFLNLWWLMLIAITLNCVRKVWKLKKIKRQADELELKKMDEDDRVKRPKDSEKF